MNFAKWLLGQMERKEWNAATFARKAKLSRQAIGYYLNGRIPDRESLVKIANALEDVTLDEVIRQADEGNTLPPLNKTTAQRRELASLVNEVAEDEVEDAIAYLRFRSGRRKQESNENKRKSGQSS